MADSRVYWAAEKSSEDFVSGAMARIKRFRDRLESTGRLGRVRRSLNAYYGYSTLGDKDASQVTQAGEAGEMAEVAVNQYGGLVQQAMVLITSSKPAFKVVAINSDYSSGAQATLADALLEDYDRKLGLSDKEYEATHASVLMGEGFAFLTWNASAGKKGAPKWDPDTQSEVATPEGDIEIESKTLFDVAFDPDVRSWETGDWVAVKRQANKFNLAARYPDEAEDLIACTQAMLYEAFNTTSQNWDLRPDTVDGDTIDFWELHHKPTPACPNGRLVIFVNDSIVLFDSYEEIEGSEECVDHGYPFDEIPLYRITPEVMIGNSAGHTAFFDLLALQQGVDLVAAIIMSAISANGVQNYWLPPGHNVSVSDIAGGMKLIESMVKPEAFSAIAIDPIVSQWADMCVSWMRQRVAINDVVMGETSKGMPAQAMALLRAQAIEFHSRFQANYERFLEKVRTGVLKILKRYADSERVAVLAGKSKTWAKKAFSAKDLSDVERFAVEPLNPVARSFAGRMEMVKDLKEMGALQTPEQYSVFMATGRLDPILEGPNASSQRLAQVKEMIQQGIGAQPLDQFGQPIADGQPHVVSLAIDKHWNDIPEIAAVIAAPGARDNPQVVMAAMSVINEQKELWKANPELAVIMGGQPYPVIQPGLPPGMPSPVGAAPPGLAPGAPSGGGAQTDIGPGDGPRSGPLAPLPEGASPIRLPKPPPNPITGEQPPSPDIGMS